MQPQAKKKMCCHSPSPFWMGVCIGIAIFAVLFLIVMAANLIKFNGGAAPKTPANNTQAPTSDISKEVVGQAGTFLEVSEPICKENGKPVVYMFSTSWCPHCQWARPLFAAAVKTYVAQGKIVAHEWELDTYDDTLTAAKETSVPAEANALYEKYNPQGSIPTFIFGCKYYRIGTGNEKSGNTAAETQEFKQLIDKLLLEK